MRRTLNEQYSLAWLQSSTIVIITMIGSLFYILSHISHYMEGTRSRLETVCESINTTSEQIFNAPSILFNATLNSMLTAKENIHRNLLTAVSVLEACIVWLVQMYKSTYRCLLGLAIHTVLSLVTQIAEPLQKAAQGITSFITGGKFVSGDWTQSLTSTQDKIDDWFKNDNDVIQRIIHQPFLLLQTQINDTLNDWKPPMYNNSLTQIKSLSTDEAPCNSLSLLESLDHVEFELTKFVKIMIGLLFGTLFFCILFNIWLIRFRHEKVTQTRALILRLFRNSRINDEEGEVLLDKSVELFPSLHQKKHLIQRLFYFMSHPIATWCLLVGLLGLITTFSLVHILESKSQELYRDFSVQTQQWTQEASAEWTHYATFEYEKMNTWISETETNLNLHAFGVIKDTAITINNTLENVVEQVHNLIQTVLGGTLLESPAKELTHCLLLTKIENIEKGLTWIVNHAYINITKVDIPKMNEMMLGPKMERSIQQHIQLQDLSLALPLKSLYNFYFMLLGIWAICLFIGIGFQVNYYIINNKKK